MNTTEVDVLIVGGGLSGIVAAQHLSRKKISCALVEKGSVLGGTNQSSTNSKGEIFDAGYHALDFNRSPLTTQLFLEAVNHKAHQIELDRGIVIQGNLLPYNAKLSDWPASLRDMFPPSLPSDSIDGELSHGKIAAIYGKKFTDLAFSDILDSYPTRKVAHQQGCEKSTLMDWVYPWFFPRNEKNVSRDDESMGFHDKMRETKQSVLYPHEGGFFGFIDGLAKRIDPAYCKVITGVMPSFEFDPNSKTLLSLTAGDHTIMFKRVLWCAPIPFLLHLFGERLPAGQPQELYLGSFSFEQKILDRYHEILVGDSRFFINRISFPGRLRSECNNLVQVEFLATAAEEYTMSGTQWKDHWSSCLRELGIIDESHVLADFEFTRSSRGFLALQGYDALIEQAQKLFGRHETNIEVPFFSLGPENINRLVPSVIHFIDKEVA